MKKTIVSVVSLLAISLIALASCSEPHQNIPGTASISVRVSDNTYAKTITPEDNVNISHYIITVVNEIEGIEQSSGYLTKGSMFTVSNVPAGIWYAKVDAYIDRGNDTYVKVASAQSEAKTVVAEENITFELILDTLDEVVSGDVTITMKMPVELSSQGKVFWYQYTITGVTNEEFTYTSKLLSGKTGTDAQATIKLDANTLGLMQGAYRFEITIQDKEVSPTLIKKGVDVMRLVNGLEATGTIDLSSYEPDQSFDVTITDKVGDIIIPTLKEDKMLYSIAMHNGSASLTVTLAEPLKSNEVIEWYIDGELDETVNTDEVSSGKYTFLFNTPGNHSVVAIVRDLDALMSVGSIGFNVVLIEFSEQLFSFSLNRDKESYTVEGLVKDVGEFKMPESGILEIPASYQGKPVTGIGYEAFEDRTDIIGSVVIPDGVTSIEESAFIRCTGLTSISIPEGVSRIGNYAFAGCSSLISINIPSSVVSIGSGVFKNCSALTGANIPYDVKSIKAQTFYGCSSLESINIPDNVTTIEERAFYGCTSLETVNIPDAVTSIEECAFYGCSSLKSIVIPENITILKRGTFSKCTSLSEVTLPSTLKSFEWISGNSEDYGVFHGCSSIESITIPYDVTSIDSYVFSDCSSLISVNIPNSVTSIGSGAFKNCSSLANIIIPDGVTCIDSYAFSGCSLLQSIIIPESVASIGMFVFEYCSVLTDVYCEATQKPKEWDTLWDWRCDFEIHWGYTGE